MPERLRFNRLVLTGPGRQYEVTFHDGVNLIAGPIYTGKSSILELLDYACGARRPPSYPEISKCSDVYVECVVGGEILTIRRSLKEGARAQVYESSIEDVFKRSLRGKDVSSRHDRELPSVSLEILERLGLARIQVKSAPTQEASDTSSFSIRDLLEVVYVDQDRIGSKRSAFHEDKPPKAIKWRAAFEIVHGLFDTRAAALARALREAQTEEQRLATFLANAQRFLDDFQVPGVEELARTIIELDAQQQEAEARLRDQRLQVEARLGDNLVLVRQREKQVDQHATLMARVNEIRRSLQQLGRLRVQYDREIAQLEFLRESEVQVASLPVVRCPACLQGVDEVVERHLCHVCKQPMPPPSEEAVPVEGRLRAARRRASDLDRYMADLEQTSENLKRQADALALEIAEVDRTLKRVEQATVLPENRRLMQMQEELSALATRRRRTAEQLDYRRKALGDGTNLAAVRERIERLRKEQEREALLQVSREGVVEDLSEIFRKILRAIGFPEVRDAWFDRMAFLPVVRGQLYGNLSSRGAISLAVSAWHLAVLEYSFELPASRFPQLLMLDSPLSHVGQDASDPAFKDQAIVDAFYAYLSDLHAKHAASFQLMLVHNRPPASARTFIATEFTRDPERGRFGLIDDEHSPLPDGATGEKPAP